MTAAVGAVGAVLDSVSGVSQTLAYPAGITTGTPLIVFGAMASSGATCPPPVSSSMVWTQGANDSTFMKSWTSVYNGTDAAPTIAVGGNGLGYVMVALSGTDTTTPIAAFATSFVTQVNMRFPGLTVANNGSLIFTFCKANGNYTSAAQSAGFTEIVDHNCTASTMALQIQYQVQSSAVSISQTDVTVTGGSSVSQTGITLAMNAASIPAIINPLPPGARQTFVTETIIQY